MSGPRDAEQGRLDARRVHGVAVDQQHALAEVVARAPQRVGVVPLLGLRVEDELERHPVALLQRRPALLEGAGRVARDHDDPVEAGVAEVGERDVQDGPVAVDGDQRLGQRVGVGRQAPSRPGCEHHPDHSATSSSSSYTSGSRRVGRRPAVDALADDDHREQPGGDPEARGHERRGGEHEPGEQPAVPAERGAVEPARRRHAAVPQPVDHVVVAVGDGEQQREGGRHGRRAGEAASHSSPAYSPTRSAGGTTQRRRSRSGPARRAPAASTSHATAAPASGQDAPSPVIAISASSGATPASTSAEAGAAGRGSRPSASASGPSSR